MKSLITISTAVTIWLLTVMYGHAQETQTGSTQKIEQVNTLKEKIVQTEKEALKTTVENVNSRLSNGEITEAEAENLKQSAAQKHALNIENKLAILENKMALMDRNPEIEPDIEDDNGFMLRIGTSDEDDDVIYLGPKNKKRKYDKRTTSDFVFAFGLNNVITKGESLEDSNFKVAGSRFAELGWAWKTRVFDNTNWLRIKYGISFQFNGLKPTDNRFFVANGEVTDLEVYPQHLKKSKFRMDNLVVPLHFEFGPSKKIESDDYFRYSTANKLTIGLGGYAGINLSTRQKLKFEEDGEDRKLKLKANYNTNNFIYGLSGYIGWQGIAAYVKYDLNTIFKNNLVDQRNVSLGLRFDVD